MSSCSEETEWFETSLSWGHILPLIFLALPIDSSSEFHIQINTRIWPLFISTLLVLPLYPNASKHVNYSIPHYIGLVVFRGAKPSFGQQNNLKGLFGDFCHWSKNRSCDTFFRGRDEGEEQRYVDQHVLWLYQHFPLAAALHSQQKFLDNEKFSALSQWFDWPSLILKTSCAKEICWVLGWKFPYYSFLNFINIFYLSGQAYRIWNFQGVHLICIFYFLGLGRGTSWNWPGKISIYSLTAKSRSN